MTESGRGADDQPVFDLFTARVQGHMMAEEAALALAGSVMGASAQSLQRQLVCVGTLGGGVSMWRLSCEAITPLDDPSDAPLSTPKPAANVDGKEHVSCCPSE